MNECVKKELLQNPQVQKIKMSWIPEFELGK